MDRNRRIIVAGLGLAALGAATGHAAPGPLAQGAQAPVRSLKIAPTGGGKTVEVILPNLRDYQGTAVVLDVKGENFIITDRRTKGSSDD